MTLIQACYHIPKTQFPQAMELLAKSFEDSLANAETAGKCVLHDNDLKCYAAILRGAITSGYTSSDLKFTGGPSEIAYLADICAQNKQFPQEERTEFFKTRYSHPWVRGATENQNGFIWNRCLSGCQTPCDHTTIQASGDVFPDATALVMLSRQLDEFKQNGEDQALDTRFNLAAQLGDNELTDMLLALPSNIQDLAREYMELRKALKRHEYQVLTSMTRVHYDLIGRTLEENGFPIMRYKTKFIAGEPNIPRDIFDSMVKTPEVDNEILFAAYDMISRGPEGNLKQ